MTTMDFRGGHDSSILKQLIGLCQVVSTGEHYFLKQPGRLR